jgi:hypothetical protein
MAGKLVRWNGEELDVIEDDYVDNYVDDDGRLVAVYRVWTYASEEEQKEYEEEMGL